MTTIEDKMNLFSKIINDRIDEEKQKDFEKFEQEKSEIIEKKNKELEENRKAVLKETSKRSQLKYNEIISQEKLKNQSLILELKKKFVSDSILDVKQKLIEFTKSKDYKEFLIKLTHRTLLSMDKGNYILYISKEDKMNYKDILEGELQNFQNINFTIAVTEEDIIGGIIIKSESGKFRINASLASKLMECDEMVGVKISEKIE